MDKRARGARVLTVAAAAVALVVLAGGAAAQDKAPVKIAAILPLSGSGTFEGQQAIEGMETMAALINADGGILGGRKIEILRYDDKSSPEEGVTAAKRAIEQDKVDAIAANMFSPIALAMKEATRDKILHVVIAPQHPNVTKEGHKWLFRINETTVMRSANFSRFVCQNMGLKSAAMITINDDYGRAESGAWTEHFTKCGVKVVGNEFFQRSDTDFTVQLTKVRSLSPDGIYVIASAAAQGATIYRQLKQLGYPGKVIASGGNMSPKLVELSGPSIEGVYSVLLYVEDYNHPTANRWREEYKKRFKNETSFVAALSAQALELVARAMDKAGTSRDYDKIAGVIRSTTWDTLMGPLRFDEIGQGFQNSYIVQVRNGKIATVGRAN